MSFTITKLTAYIATDEKGEEGVVSFMGTDGKWMPLICADERRIQLMHRMAMQISASTGKSLKIIQFSERKDVTEETMNKYGH